MTIKKFTFFTHRYWCWWPRVFKMKGYTSVKLFNCFVCWNRG